MVYRHGKKTTEHAEFARRFESEQAARKWLRSLPGKHRIRRLYRPTIDTL